MLLRYSGASRTDDAELAVGLQKRRRRGSAQRRLHDTVDVVDAEPVARRLGAIDPDVQIRLAEHPERAEIGNALHLRHFAHGRLRDLLEGREVRPDDLDRIGAFDPRQPFLDVVLDVLREIEIDADELVVEFGLQFVDQLFLGHAAPAIRRTA